MVKSETSYTKQTTTVKKYPRPFGHAVRVAVTLLGLWMYFLLVVCIPRGKTADKLHDQSELKDSYLMMAAGSGMVQGCAFIFFFFVLWGVRRTNVTRIVGIVLLVIYVLGGAIFIIGEGIYTDKVWDNKTSDDDAWRSLLVGHLIGESCFIVVGVLTLLPEFGIMNDWEAK
eukprot:TRINITY_DN28_c5_g1_i1.p1 TRINITY_DN28_c5_g1~~TRINITY_DN28_c5_g1_i1.p1  ORF type:complete len:186 (+),score=50.86 TRINITY_DN28_c5_g1_i1:46-558(+)